MIPRLLTLIFAVCAFAALLGPVPNAFAESKSLYTSVKPFVWPRWGHGAELGVRSLGHYGRGGSTNAPPGGLNMVASYHGWYEHLFEAHASVGVGLSNSTFTYGLGAKVNLFEFVDDPSGQIFDKGFQRGLLSKLLRNFMIFAGVNLTHYSFPDPPANQGLTYDTRVWSVQPMAGAQWYINLELLQARRFYVETTLGYTSMASNKYLVLFLGLGLEFK